MLHRVIVQGSFCALLLRIDQDLAEEVRPAGCDCGGPRHRANYPRSPRGTPVCVPEEWRPSEAERRLKENRYWKKAQMWGEIAKAKREGR